MSRLVVSDAALATIRPRGLRGKENLANQLHCSEHQNIFPMKTASCSFMNLDLMTNCNLFCKND